MDNLTIFGLGIISAILGGIWLVKIILRMRAGHPIVDHSVMSKHEGYTSLSAHHANLIGRRGIALTDLKPNRYIDIQGDRIDAQSRGDFVQKGSQVKVIGSEGNFIIVIQETAPMLEAPNNMAN